jgi:hypothetical protein
MSPGSAARRPGVTAKPAVRIEPMTHAHDPRWDGLLLGASLATLDAESGYGEVLDGALGWRDGVITYVGPVPTAR